jgi:hypothetical protein
MSEAQLPKASSARVRKQAAAALLSLLAWAERQNFNLPADLFNLPADLSEKHDAYRKHPLSTADRPR